MAAVKYILALASLLTCVLLATRLATRLPTPAPASGPATEFSEARAFALLESIAAGGPRELGSGNLGKVREVRLQAGNAGHVVEDLIDSQLSKPTS